MTIKHPSTADLPRLRELWQAAFGDTPAFIDGFFRTGFSEGRCLLAEEKGQLLAALYWFDCLWDGKKLAYLYAIATNEDHRGKGVCKALMGHTHGMLAQTGYAGAILVPADDGLSRMYEKMGYTPCCPMKKHIAPTGIVQISPMEYMALRPDYLPERAVHHTEPAFCYLATYAKFYRFPGGICCGSVSENKLHLQELLPVGADDHIGPNTAMYRSFTEDKDHPTYFALDMG